MKKWSIAGFCAALSACSVGPNYHPPVAPVPVAYKELEAWKPSEPSDTAPRGQWWTVYNDPVLNDLESQVAISNQNVKEAEASYRQAAAIVQEATASFFPTISASSGATRAQRGSSNASTLGLTSANSALLASATKPVNDFTATASASWTLDVWGSVRRTVQSDVANAQASAATLANATLSYQATLATDYFQLRVEDELKDLLDQASKAYGESLKIAQNKYTAGISTEADVMQAKTQLESTQAQDIATGIMRAELEHAIAVLIGKPPGDFSLKSASLTVELPPTPVGLPSTLLERRPDVASAERKMASANAQIGVAIASFFPDISLSGSYGASSTAFDTLLNSSNRLWSIGASGAETIFNGGARLAQVRGARAAYDQQVATYRQTVLSAFQNVEDELASVAILAHQAEIEDQAVRDAKEAERVFLNQYRAGTVDYTSVVTAQTTALNNEESALNVRGSRFTASVALIEAVGGGFSAADLQARSVVHSCIGCSNAETSAKKAEAVSVAKTP